MIYNKKIEMNEIDDIMIVDNLKYLGFTICNKRKLFSKHIDHILKKGQMLSNLTYSVIERSVNKVLIGKIYWKQVALPSILYGTAVIDFSEHHIEKLQKIENFVYRKILGAPKCTPIGRFEKLNLSGWQHRKYNIF